MSLLWSVYEPPPLGRPYSIWLARLGMEAEKMSGLEPNGGDTMRSYLHRCFTARNCPNSSSYEDFIESLIFSMNRTDLMRSMPTLAEAAPGLLHLARWSLDTPEPSPQPQPKAKSKGGPSKGSGKGKVTLFAFDVKSSVNCQCQCQFHE